MSAGREGADELDDALARLADRARARNSERVDRILALLAAPVTSDVASRRRAEELAHGVVGSAGTFGEEEMSDAARSLELALQEGARDDVVEAAVARLRDSLGRREP